MRLKALLTLLFVFAATFSFAQSGTRRQKLWTVEDVKAWNQENKDRSTWRGWILYQGSDSLYHYFVARITDNWQWFKIKRSELGMADERVHKATSSGPLGYYYVDPEQEFRKVKDY